MSKKRPIFSLDLSKTLFLPLRRGNISGGRLKNSANDEQFINFCDNTVVNLAFMIEIQQKRSTLIYTTSSIFLVNSHITSNKNLKSPLPIARGGITKSVLPKPLINTPIFKASCAM
jgi:hypothetical protein